MALINKSGCINCELIKSDWSIELERCAVKGKISFKLNSGNTEVK